MHCNVHCTALCIVLYYLYIVLYFTMYCIVHCIVMYIVLYCIVHCIVVYIVLYCIAHCIAHCNVLCIVLWCGAKHSLIALKIEKKCASANKVLCMCLTLNNVMICLTILYFRTRIKIFCGGEYFGLWDYAIYNLIYHSGKRCFWRLLAFVCFVLFFFSFCCFSLYEVLNFW